MQIFDTHAHLYFPSFEGKLDDILAQCEAAGVRYQTQIGCDEISSLAAVEMAHKYKGFTATVGLHPCDVQNVGILNPEYHRYSGFEDYQLTASNFEELFALFETLAEENSEQVVGFGETGFDLYHENSEELLALQTDSFLRHLDLCEKFQKPFVLHSRGAKKETLHFLKTELPKRNLPEVPGVWHCFCEDLEAATVAVDQGMMLGIGGVLTYNNTDQIREAVTKVPLEFLVTETDAPFLIPRKAKNRKIRLNSAAQIPEIISLIAELKSIEVEECADILFKNGKRLFL